MAASVGPSVAVEPGIRCGGVERSWAQVRERAARIASGFAELGVGSG